MRAGRLHWDFYFSTEMIDILYTCHIQVSTVGFKMETKRVMGL